MTASDSDCSIDWLASDDDSSDSGEGSESELGRRAGATVSPQPSGGSCGVHGQCWTSGSPPRGDDNAKEGGGDGSNDVGAWDCLRGRLDEKPQAPPAWRPSLCAAGLKRPCCQQGSLEHRGRQQQLEGEAEKDKLFARKCRELQSYVLPLASILNGLQSGRYRERLNSFQESVAMDRIRRILGVLQNPCAGERYINIILKVEVMLKTWFPNVKPREQQAGDHGQEATPSKRQKVCPGTTAFPASASIPASLGAHSVSDKAQGAGLKWLHTAPIFSSTELGLGGPRPRGTTRERAVTQDNAVSSSTDPASNPSSAACSPPPPQSRPPSGKISAPCLERLLKSTESIVTRRGVGGPVESGLS